MQVRFIRLPEVQSRVGYSRVTIWRLEQEGKFPLRRKLGSGEGGAVAWVESEIDAWIEEKLGPQIAKNPDPTAKVARPAPFPHIQARAGKGTKR